MGQNFQARCHAALRNRRRSDRGFSLVELLVVVSIITVLAGVAIPVYLGQKDKATHVAVLSDLRTWSQNMESVKSETLEGNALPQSSTLIAKLQTTGFSKSPSADTNYGIAPNCALLTSDLTQVTPTAVNGAYIAFAYLAPSDGNSGRTVVYDSRTGTTLDSSDGGQVTPYSQLTTCPGGIVMSTQL